MLLRWMSLTSSVKGGAALARELLARVVETTGGNLFARRPERAAQIRDGTLAALTSFIYAEEAPHPQVNPPAVGETLTRCCPGAELARAA